MADVLTVIRSLARSDQTSRYSLRQVALMIEISEIGGSLDFGDAARMLRAPKSAITRCCDKLEAHGYITRHPLIDDRRRVTLGLTESGVRFVRDHIIGATSKQAAAA